MVEIYSDMIGTVFHTVKFTVYDLMFESDNIICYFYHDQECCENVHIDAIVGDLEDLVDAPLTEAECVSINKQWDAASREATTETYYKFRTKKGCVTVKWISSSNETYSHKVSYKVIDWKQAISDICYRLNVRCSVSKDDNAVFLTDPDTKISTVHAILRKIQTPYKTFKVQYEVFNLVPALRISLTTKRSSCEENLFESDE